MRLRSRLWLVMMVGVGSAMGQVDTSAWPVVRMDVMTVDAKGGALAVAGKLEASVDELCRLMGNRVILSYETPTPARDGRERQVSVALGKAHRKQKAAVFAAEGYYAPSH